MSGEVKINLIMERVAPGKSADCFVLYACRNKSPECPTVQKSGTHCTDCVLPDDNETIENLCKRLARGDA